MSGCYVRATEMTAPGTFRIWEGIYRSFAETPGNAAVFTESTWVERSRNKALRIRELARTAATSPSAGGVHEYCLPVIAAVAQTEAPHLRILDFGGAVGFTFHAVASALGRPKDVELHIVDNAAICKAGREVFADEPRVSFHERVPDDLHAEIVHLGSSIQYVDDWAALIEVLVAHGPKYLVFDDVPAGPIPTFATAQYYYGRYIPHRFFNLDEFVDTVSRVTGYELFYKARYLGAGPYPMDHFPEDHRIDHPYHFAFARGRDIT